jgi:hypothetical protein
MVRLILLGLTVAGIFGVVGHHKWTLRQECREPATQVRLTELTRDGAAGNRNVEVTDVRFATKYHFMQNGKTGRVEGAYLPLVTRDGRIVALLRSSIVSTPEQVERLARATTVRGIVRGEVTDLRVDQAMALREADPTVDLMALPIIHHGERVPSEGDAVGMFFIAAVGVMLVAYGLIRLVRG